jgi:hypothetical protein
MMFSKNLMSDALLLGMKQPLRGENMGCDPQQQKALQSRKFI